MNKKIVITGASRGIGKELAYLLAEKGYDLFLIASKSYEGLKKVKKDIEEKYNGISVDITRCDVGNAEEVSEVLSEITDIYALINNAAISSIKLITDMEVSEWNRIVDVNLNSVFYTTRAVVKGMISKKEGKIINVSSVWGNVGASMEVCYSTTKGGINAFTKALAKELAPSNIQVNAVAFGIIDTDMNKCFSSEELQEVVNEIPSDRMGSPKEAALMIVNVLEAPEYLTGQVITMDGGWI